MFKIDAKKKTIVLVYTLCVFSTVFHVFSGFFGQSCRFEFIVPVSKFTLFASIFFQLVIIGVAMGLQSCILNLFRILVAYLPCLRKISPFLCQTSNPRNNASVPKPSCRILRLESSFSPRWAWMILSEKNHPHITLGLEAHSLWQDSKY